MCSYKELLSPVAQQAEQVAVNHWVRGSNPRGGANPIRLIDSRSALLKVGVFMARICEICGKGTVSGNSVSKSKIHKKRTWKPNLVKVKTEIDGRTITIRMCSRCLKSDFVTKKV